MNAQAIFTFRDFKRYNKKTFKKLVNVTLKLMPQSSGM